MMTHKQELKLLLAISHAIQKINKLSDIKSFTFDCAKLLKASGMPLATLAIHRLTNEKRGCFQTFRYLPNGTIDTTKAQKRPTLFRLWQNQTPTIMTDLQKDKPQEGLTALNARFNQLKLNSLVDFPFANGILSVHSVIPNAFSQANIQVLSEISHLLAMALTRINDLERIETQMEALTDSSQRLRNITTNMPGIVYQFMWSDKQELSIPFISDSCTHLTGLTPETIYQNPHALLAKIYEPDRESFMDSIAHSAQHLTTWHWEGRANLPQGERWFRASSIPLKNDVGSVIWNGLLIDITQEHHAQVKEIQQTQIIHRHKQLLQAVDRLAQTVLSSLNLDHVLDTLSKSVLEAGIFQSLMLALVDEPNQCIEVVRSFQLVKDKKETPSFIHLTDLSSKQQKLHIQTDNGVLGLRYALNASNITAETARTGKMQMVETYDDNRLDRNFDKNPEDWQNKVAYFMPIKQNNRVLAVLATGSTADEKEEALQRIAILEPLLNTAAIAIAHAQLYRELENQRVLSTRTDRLRSLGQMATGMAHELNQPLQGIRGTAEVLLIGANRQWKMTDKEFQDHLHFIIDQADRMNHTIDHVRIFAREAGKPEHYPVDVQDVIVATTKLLLSQFQSRGLDLNIKTEPHLPQVMANPFSLEEVLINLLINARDATEDLRLNATDHPLPPICISTYTKHIHKTICIDICDQGVGIPENIADQIFDPFFTTKSPDKGTGLGLAISKSIIEEFGGELQLKSNPGHHHFAHLFLIQTPVER